MPKAEFVNEIVGGTVPEEIPAVEKGIAEQMRNGVLAVIRYWV